MKQKYGEAERRPDRTFGTLAAKAAIKDVGRVLDVPLDRVNHLTQVGLAEAGHRRSRRRSRIARVPHASTRPTRRSSELIDIALKLEGTNRNAGTHAAGRGHRQRADHRLRAGAASSSGRTTTATTPRRRVTTQWVMGDLEKVGMLKMDFLGLRTLTLVDNA